ncbi:hypothetical protein PBR20603_02359 [Pandoraea bronchicola]|uniref:Resolvase HTH domain-containing protein n=2 Tax=Pandoraea bronchicola TaxID=2508287 RepID=A0A5E5BS00_9BURK|nr:hypothetical protein PBR20603_02359 [Pandoraea bronchicola]
MAGLRMSAAQWDALRREYANGTSAKALAKRYQVSPLTIYSRASGERWRDAISQPAAKEVK